MKKIGIVFFALMFANVASAQTNEDYSSAINVLMNQRDRAMNELVDLYVKFAAEQRKVQKLTDELAQAKKDTKND